MMHANSIDAFVEIAPKLNNRQKEVLAVYNFGDYTDKEVAQILGCYPSEVCNRIGELIKMDKLMEVDTRIQNGRKVRVCGLPRELKLF